MPQLTIDDIDAPIETRVDRVAIAYVHVENKKGATAVAAEDLDVTVDEICETVATEELAVNEDTGDAVLHIDNQQPHAAQQLIDAVATLPVDRVECNSIGAIADSLEDTVTVAEYVTDQGATITTAHATGEHVTIEQGSEVLETLKDAAAIARTNDRTPTITTIRAGEDVEGRPGLGFEICDGNLVKTDEFEEIRAVLKAVIQDEGGLSKRAAARRLDTSRRTITRCIDERPEEYDLK
jgi:DNA invertase Pin-like site-specific DNA recombinase